MPHQDSYLSTSHAAKVLGVAPTTIKGWAEKGIINVWKTAGGHRRISKQSVDAILQQRKKALLQSNNQKSISLLVVDDDSIILSLYETMVESWSIPITLYTAKSGFDALILIGRNTPDVIITDLAMPDMDGFQMIHRLRKREELKNTPIIVVTALDSDEINKQGGLPVGMSVFQKPIPGENLESLVRKQSEALGVAINNL
ncbi:MAG: response regulator [Magnetococcales bacterium]|nr:response regulator [Magnetococcales bacterium]